MGLGLLGGGMATARWLVEQGAILTITDTKDEKLIKFLINSFLKQKIHYSTKKFIK